MARTLIEAKISTREQRKKLAIRSKPYWRGIDPDVHLGYRKGRHGGKWVVRLYLSDQDYQQETFATADDELREGTLDFRGAVRAARDWVETARREARAVAEGPSLTVRNAVETYTAARDARDSARKGRLIRSDASSRLGLYVVGVAQRGKRKAVLASPIADIALHDLSERDLLDWRDALPDTLKWTTKRRLVSDLKAALNAAYVANRKRLPTTLPETIKHGLSVLDRRGDVGSAARENQILNDSQVARLIQEAREVDAEQEWDGDLLRMIWVLAATGTRFSQAARLKVGDVQAKAGQLMIPVSDKGQIGKTGHIRFPIDSDLLNTLLAAAAGRPKDAFLLERWRRRQIAGGIRWQRSGRGPWQSSSELARSWAIIRERAGLPGIPIYAFRHSSIVRFLRDNQPTALVAKLHETSVPIIESHYGRHIADGLHELAARSVFRLESNDDRNKIVPSKRA